MSVTSPGRLNEGNTTSPAAFPTRPGLAAGQRALPHVERIKESFVGTLHNQSTALPKGSSQTEPKSTESKVCLE